MTIKAHFIFYDENYHAHFLPNFPTVDLPCLPPIGTLINPATALKNYSRPKWLENRFYRVASIEMYTGESQPEHVNIVLDHRPVMFDQINMELAPASMFAKESLGTETVPQPA